MNVNGRVERRFEPVREAFAEVLAVQRGTGAAVAAWWDGTWVVDLWGGRADAAGTRTWQQDSVVQPYSVSKPFAALCTLTLVDRGERARNGQRGGGLVRRAAERCTALPAVAQGGHLAAMLGRGRGLRRAQRLGAGFSVDEDGFGMGGSGGSYAGACPAAGYAFSYVTGTMGSHDRASAVENAFRDCLGLPPLRA